MHIFQPFTRHARALCAAVLLAASGSAAADDHWQWPSKYGADDTLGAINMLEARHVRQAAALVKRGKTAALGMVTGRSTPAYPPRNFNITILQPGDGRGLPQGSNGMTGNDDYLATWIGIGSQLDGLGHIGIDHVYYNGRKAEDFVDPTGLKVFGTHAVPPIVTRGVVLDIAGLHGKARLDEGDVITPQDIEGALERQAVALAPGDVVLFHTGWMQLLGSEDARFGAGEPGLGVPAARYLVERGAVAVGADTWGLEAVPHAEENTAFPVHQELLAKNGIYILENMVTADLVADEAWEFLFVLGHPRIEGAVQAIINPVAIY